MSRSKVRLAYKITVTSSVHCPYAKDLVILDRLFLFTGSEKDFNLKSYKALIKEFINILYHDKQLIRRSLILSDYNFNKKDIKSLSRKTLYYSIIEKKSALLSQSLLLDNNLVF